MHAAALAWTMPGFAAFDTGSATHEEPAPPATAGDAPADTADAPQGATADPAGDPDDTSVAASGDAPAPAESTATPTGGTPNGDGASVPARDGGDGDAAGDSGANGNGHAAPAHREAEAGPEPVGGEGSEEGEIEPSIADAIDAMNAVPTADGGPRVIVQQVGRVNGSEAGDDALEIPEFLRRVH